MQKQNMDTRPKKNNMILADNAAPVHILQQQYQNFLEDVNRMVAVLDVNGRVIFCNDFLLKHLEMSRQQLEGHNLMKLLVPPDQFEAAFQRVKHQIDSGEKNSSVIHDIFLHSQLQTLSWTNTAVHDSAGQIEYLVCFGEDVTDQKKNEKDNFQHLETLEQNVADRTLELETLYAVATIANEVLELPVMLEKMLIQTLNAIGVPYGAIHLFDQDEVELHLVAQVGISPEIVKRISSITTGFGLTGWVAQRKHPLTLTQVSDDPRILAIGRVSGFSLYLSSPLLSQNKILGVISVFGDTAQQLNPERIALLTTIADQIGTAVDRTHLRQQAAQSAILEERARVARELHDSVTQSLYSLTLLAAASQRSVQDGSHERTLRNLDNISLIAFQTLKEMRLLVYELQPSTLGSGGLAEAVQRRLDAVEEHSGMQAKLINDHPIVIPNSVEIELYGLIQEALNNSIKHGNATSVTVQLDESEDSILLEIKDNGKGFDLKQAEKKHGAGLISMYKRVENLGGKLDILTSLNQGTAIKAVVPKQYHKSTPDQSLLEDLND